MNILFFFDRQINPTKGGTERATYLIAHALKNIKYNVFYLSVYPVENSDTKIQTYFLPEKNNIISFENKKFIENLCVEREIDIIINECGNGDYINLFSSNFLNCKSKIITMLHFSVYEGLNYFKEFLRFDYSLEPMDILRIIPSILKAPYNKARALRLKKKRFLNMYQGSDAVVVLSKSYVYDFLELTGLKDCQNIYAISNPQSFKIEEDIEDILRFKENEILFVGRLSYQEKRVDRLLNIWNEMHDFFPDWKLTIVGEGPERENLERKSRSLNLKRVSFEGHQNPESYYKRAKIFAMTSTHEGMPMVVIEAMQYGCVPVLFNSFGSANEIINHSQNGILIPPFNKKIYKSALVDIMSDDNKRINMAHAAFVKCKDFEPHCIVKHWNSLLLSLSDNN